MDNPSFLWRNNLILWGTFFVFQIWEKEGHFFRVFSVKLCVLVFCQKRLLSQTVLNFHQIYIHEWTEKKWTYLHLIVISPYPRVLLIQSDKQLQQLTKKKGKVFSYAMFVFLCYITTKFQRGSGHWAVYYTSTQSFW